MHAPDRLITYHLSHTKIITILLLQEGLIMALHYNYEYRVLKLQLPECVSIGQGKLPQLSQQIQKYDRNKVIYVCEGRLQVFDWVCKEVIVVSQFTCSAIYSNFFAYYLADDYVAFWKQSSLKHQENYTYQIEIFTKSSHKLIRKHRIQLKTLHSLALVSINQSPQLVLYQTQGYNLTVQYPDLNLSHEIKSIYKLLLVDAKVKQQKLYLYFTHNELVEEILLVYEVQPYSMRKDYETKLPNNYIKLDQNYQLILPNFVACYGKPSCEVTARIKFRRQFKMVLLLHELLGKDEEISQVLVKQFVNLIQQC